MRICAVVIIALASLASVAGAAVVGSQKWGEVSPEEWSLAAPSGYPESKALVIFDNGFAVAEISGLELKRHLRMKILTDEGVDLFSTAIIETREYDGIDDVHAIVHKPDGQSFEIKDDNIVKQKDDENRSVTISFPDLGAGDILEYRYRIKYYGGVDKLGAEKYFLFSQSIAWQWLKDRKLRVVEWDEDLYKNITNVPTWWFDHPAYTLYSKFQVKLGADLDYTCIPANLPVGKQAPESHRGSGIIDRVYKYHTWEIEDIPVIPPEPFMGYPDTYRPALYFELFSTNGENRILLGKYSDEQWRNVGRNIQGYLDMYEKRPRRFQNKVRELIAEAQSDHDCVKTLYEHVRDNYEIEERRYELRPLHKNLRELYSQKKGTPLELNLMLVQMLKTTGHKAWPVLINTRGEIDFRLTARFNHAIVYAELDQGGIFMDASQPGCPFGMLPPVCRVTDGVLVDFDSSHVVPVMMAEPDTYRRDSLTISIGTDGSISGSAICQLSGYLAIEAAGHILTSSTDRGVDSVPLAMSGFDRLSDLSWSEDSLTKAIRFAGEFDSISATVDNLSLASVIWSLFATNPFESPVRYQPVDFQYPLTYEVSVALQSELLPETHSLPADTAFGMVGARLEFSSATEADVLQVSFRVQLDSARFDAAQYPAVREFFFGLEELFGRPLTTSPTGD